MKKRTVKLRVMRGQVRRVDPFSTKWIPLTTPPMNINIPNNRAVIQYGPVELRLYNGRGDPLPV